MVLKEKKNNFKLKKELLFLGFWVVSKLIRLNENTMGLYHLFKKLIKKLHKSTLP